MLSLLGQKERHLSGEDFQDQLEHHAGITVNASQVCAGNFLLMPENANQQVFLLLG